MKTIQLTLFKTNLLKNYVVENIKSYYESDNKFGDSFTVIELCDGNSESVSQSIQEISDLINS